jgi:hypothetical protein
MRRTEENINHHLYRAEICARLAAVRTRRVL